MTPLLAAGVGATRGWRSGRLRSASFRLDAPGPPDAPLYGVAPLGIAISRQSVATTLVDLLAGLIRPAYGELRVLGEDLTTARGRSALRTRVGVARRDARPQPAFRVRGLVEHAARLAGLPAQDRDLMAAAIVDRLALTPWSDVPLRSAPDVISRRARLAAAAVHQPDLLLIDGMLDDLGTGDTIALAEAIRDLGRDMIVVAVGRDASALELACTEVLTVADGILVQPAHSPQPEVAPVSPLAPPPLAPLDPPRSRISPTLTHPVSCGSGLEPDRLRAQGARDLCPLRGRRAPAAAGAG
jgi:ABC-type cobalamin/Fe3+-siderophores transport system ATPase subunit